jgi:hypothetical protein
MIQTLRDWRAQVERDGFAILPEVYPPDRTDEIRQDLAGVLAYNAGSDESVRGPVGTVYAARNVLTLWPAARDVWRVSPLADVLADVLGPRFGLIRALYFDKPPEQTWSLPWHKDLTVAVRDNRRPSRRFGKPTTKAGVPHAEAPLEILELMLTARVHLDVMTEANGPLQVVPGSHHTGKAMPAGDIRPRVILGNEGDVLLMRPLLAHASGKSHPETREHRRVLHLEFAATPQLPDGYEWYTFVPAKASWSAGVPSRRDAAPRR